MCSALRWVRGCVLVCVALAAGAPALGAGLNWDIDSCDVRIRLVEDGSMVVTESMQVDFTRQAHRGIIREIPYAYRRQGVNFNLRIDVLSVTDERGREWRRKVWRDDGRLFIRIGDPDVTLNRVVHYSIQYRVRRALLAFETHDELYWNSVGDEWAVPMGRVTCMVELPGPAGAGEDVQTTSYIGPRGSTAHGPDPSRPSQSEWMWTLENGLRPRSGLTVVVGIPKGMVAAPSAMDRAWWVVADNLVLATPVVVFAGLFLLVRARGRDEGNARPIVVRYEAPDDLTPVEAGTLIDEVLQTSDVTATLVDLAVRGHLVIEVDADDLTKKIAVADVTLRRTRDGGTDGALRGYERELLDALFEDADTVELSDLQYTFSSKLARVRKAVYADLARRGYTHGNFDSRRSGWIVLGVLLTVLTVGAAVVLVQTGVFAPVATIVAAALTAPMFPIFLAFMPRKTAKGRRAVEQIKGLEEYIGRAAREEIERRAERAHFERLLPYAMALGMAEKWATRFEGLYDTPPQWLAAPHAGSHFSTWMLVHTLNGAGSKISTSMAAVPRSSGGGGSSFGSGGSGFSGGFSGGGGGGGGGGAW